MVTMEGFRSWRLSPYQSKRPDFPAAGRSDTSNFFPKPEAELSRTVSMVARFIFSPLACSRPARVSTGAEKRGIKLGRFINRVGVRPPPPLSGLRLRFIDFNGLPPRE